MLGVSFTASPLYLMRQSLPKLAFLLVCPAILPRGSPVSTSQNMGFQVGCHTHQAFTWLLEIKTQFLILSQEAYLLNTPAPALPKVCLQTV